VRPPATPLSGFDIAFHDGYALSESAEVALEDYAREVTRSREAEAIRGEGHRVVGVRLGGVESPCGAGAIVDVEDFARSLLSREDGGLGWS
jgi:hypothetical protein